MSSLQEAIAAAKAKSATATGTPQTVEGQTTAAVTEQSTIEQEPSNVVANAPSGPAVSQVQNAVVPSKPAGMPAQMPQPGKVMTLRDAASRPSFAVEKFLKVNEFGIFFSQDETNTFFETMMLIIRPGNIQPAHAIKYGKNPTEYRKTYDGVLTTDGRSWEDAVALAKRVEPDARPYFTVDVSGELVDDLKDKKGNLLASKGTIVGFSTPTTNAALVDQFIKAHIDDLESKNLILTLGYQSKAKGTYKWGLFTFNVEGEFTE